MRRWTGVGSARLLDRLCKREAAYRWLCGGVGVNYHTLSDFRSDAGLVLDDLLSCSIAGLIASGASRCADGGGRRAFGCGHRPAAGSFRTGERLQELHAAARRSGRAVAGRGRGRSRLGGTADKARRQAAAEDRLRRLEEARRAHAEIEERRVEEAREQRRKKPRDGKPARASTSGPQARVMKMGDGGYRPAYNVQFTTTVATSTSSASR